MTLVSGWGGGLVFQGGVLGGALALLVYAVYVQLPILPLMDLAAPAVSLGQAIGWVGALRHGAGYGLVMRTPVSVWLPDLYGVYGPRFPTQIASSCAFAGLFVLLDRCSQRPVRHGVPALLYLMVSGSIQFLLEFTRADAAIFYVGILRATQVAAALEALAAAVALVWLRVRFGAFTVEG
jgi:phosphatidylglycerol:prolipoprotein diacylglycerol transferase